MTSRISFSNLVRSEMKKLNWLLAVQALAFGLLMPFKLMLVLAVRASEKARYGYEWNISGVFSELAGFDQVEQTFLILAAGILCAMAVFSYLHSAVKLDFYHSLSIKREHLFAVKLVSSFMTFAIPYVICQGLNVLIGLAYKVMNAAIVTEMLVDTLLGILHFFGSYAGTVLAIMLTGKMVTTFFAVAALVGYVPVVYALTIAMQSLFMSNSLMDFDNFSGAVMRYSSPWAFCLSGGDGIGISREGVTGDWPSLAYLCQLAALIVILLLICVWLYRKRRTEVAGSALAFRKSEGIIKVLLTVLAALAAAIVAHEMLMSLFWELAFIVLFGILACVIIEVIYRADIRQALSHKLHMVITIVLAAGIFLFVKYDTLGYNSYVPEKNEIAAMSMKDNMLLIQYDTGTGYPAVYNTGFHEELLDYLETDTFDLLYEVAAEGASFVDEGDSYENRTRVGVKYRLKDGKEIYRAYWVQQDKYLEAMDELMKDKEFREKLFPILTWDEQMVKSMAASIWMPEVQMAMLYNEVLKLSEDEHGSGETGNGEDTQKVQEEADYLITGTTFASDDLWQLVQAYRKDLEDITYSEVFGMAGELNFHWNEKQKCYYGDYPLNIEFEHTMEVLAEMLTS